MHGDPRIRARLQKPHPADLLGESLAPVVATPRPHVVGGHAVCREFLQREVDPPAKQVFADIPDEVRQLERDPEVARVVVRTLAAGFQDRNHLQTDDGSGSVHVLHKVVVGLVLLDCEVHSHRVEERLEVVRRDRPADRGVDGRSRHRVIAVSAVQVRQELIGPLAQCSGSLLRCVGRVDRVHDLVGIPGQPVQGVHERALGGRQ